MLRSYILAASNYLGTPLRTFILPGKVLQRSWTVMGQLFGIWKLMTIREDGMVPRLLEYPGIFLVDDMPHAHKFELMFL